MPIHAIGKKQDLEILPKDRAFLSKVDENADAASTLIPKQNPNHVAPKLIKATPVSRTNRSFFDKFEKMDISSASIEEVLWMAAVAFMMMNQESESEMRQADKHLQRSLERATAEAVRAHLDWALTMALIQGGASTAGVAAPGCNLIGNTLPNGQYVDMLKTVLNSMDADQAKAFGQAIGASNVYLDGISKSNVTRTATAQREVQEAEQSSKSDMRSKDSEIQKSFDLLRNILQQKLQTARDAIGAR